MRRLLLAAVCLALTAAPTRAYAQTDLWSFGQNAATIYLRPTATPALPPANTRGIYFDQASGKLYAIDYLGATVDLEAAGAGGTPAATVVTETALGQASAVGVDADYAREDHTHGSVSEATIEAAVDLQDLQGAVTDAQVPNTITIDLATAATALAANPADCGANQFATTIAASGALTCAAIVDADIPDTITINLATTSTSSSTANALAADPANCAAGSAAGGILASGAAEACVVMPVTKAAVASNFLTSYTSGTGAVTAAQPAFSDISGSVTDAQVPDTITVTAYTTVQEEGASLAQERILNFTGGAITCIDVGGTTTRCNIPTVAIANGGTGQTTQTEAFDALSPNTTQGDIDYHNGTDNVRLAKGVAYQDLRMNSGATAPEWGQINAVLASPVAVAVNATYVTVFTVQPILSKTNNVAFRIFHAASATTVGMQFRVSSADTGNVGTCSFLHMGITAIGGPSAVDHWLVVTAIAAAPADTAALGTFNTTFNTVYIDCAFTSDGTPGTVLLEAQLETGTTSTNILAGSSYTYSFN